MDADLRSRVASLEEELAALRKREEELSDFIENGSIALHWVGPDGSILWANQAELDMLGYSRDDYVGHKITQFHADAPAIEDILQRLTRNETLHNYEARLRCKDGSIRHVLISSNVRFEGDQFVHTRCFTRDITDRKNSEQELREAHELLSALLHSSPLPVVVFQPSGAISLWNAAAERAFGWRAEEVLGKPIPFVPADKLEEHRAMRALDLEGPGFSEIEVERKRKDGTTIHLRVSTSPLRDAAGNVTAIISVYSDISDRRRYEQRLLAQYSVARILAGASSMAEAAPALIQTLGETLGWQAGLVWMPHADASALRCEALWQQPSEQSGRFEAACRTRTFASGEGLPGRIWADKHPAWIIDLGDDTNFPRLAVAAARGLRSAFGFPIMQGTTVLGVVEFFSDDLRRPDDDMLNMASGIGYQIGEFVERTRAQQSLADREESYRVLTETASDGIISIDAASKIRFANTAAGKIFGYTREELLGTDLTTLMPDYLRNVHKSAVERYLTTGQKHLSWLAVPLPGMHKDGHEVPLEISFAEYQQESRHVFIGIVRDVTERKRFEEKLRQTAKLESLGLLAGGIAHDFNNLLTGILGNVSLASEMISEVHPAQSTLSNAGEAAERAAHLTKQLLAYAGKGRFVIQPINLSVLVREISTLVKTSIPKNVQIQMDVADELPSIEGDIAQIQQLIMNLFINGAEAIDEGTGGMVRIHTGVQDIDQHYIDQTAREHDITPGKYVTLEVHDTGSGMDDATISQIFDPFFTTKFTGRGLGLAAVLGIVRGHKGAINVYSSKGKGSTFKVLFPASAASIPAREPGGAQRHFSGLGTVMVVDDEEIVRKAAKSLLERFGYTVLLAENGKQAVEMLAQRRGDVALIILDLTMPVMNGEEALSRLQSINPSVPVMLSSGYNEMEAIQRFAGKGLAGFVQKPYTSARLAEKLRAILGEKVRSV